MITEPLGQTRRVSEPAWAGLGIRLLLLIFLAALAVRLAAVVVWGPRLGLDSAEYIGWGRDLAALGPSAFATLRVEHAPLYGLFLAPGAMLPGLDLPLFAVLAQSILGAATAVLVARITSRETGSRLAGVCAGALTAIHVSFVFWTVYVLSETLFLFLLALCADRALLLWRSTRPAVDAAVVTLLGVLAVAARPTGLAFLIGLAVLVIWSARAHSRPDALRLVAGFLVPLVAFVMLGAAAVATARAPSLASLSYLSEWSRSALVNGLLWTETGRGTTGVDLDVYPPPIADTLPADERDDFLRLGPGAFAAQHPDFAAAQALRKLRAFWSPILPEYSRAHAVSQGVYFCTFYLLAVMGALQSRRASALLLFVAVNIGLFTLTSVLTLVDYDQRYRLPAELFLLPLAGIGLAALIGRVLSASARRRQRERSLRPLPS